MLKTLFAAILAVSPMLAYTAHAGETDDRATVRAFYTDLLSNPRGDDLGERVRNVVTEDWVSIPTPRGGPGAEGITKTLAGFGALVPDLKWEIQEILTDGNRYVVRGRATGTPTGPFLGVAPSGKSFDIMTIDIHTVENGRIVQSYHVEEWATAIRQLTQ